MHPPRRHSLLFRPTSLRLGAWALPLMLGCGHTDALRVADSAPGAEPPFGAVAVPVVPALAAEHLAEEPNQAQKVAAVEAIKETIQQAPPPPLVTRSSAPVSAINEDEATVRYIGEKACLVHFAGATTLFHANGLAHLLKLPSKIGKGKAAKQPAPTLELGAEAIDIVAIGAQNEADISRSIALALHRQFKPVFLVPAGGKVKAQLIRFGIPRANIHDQSAYSESATDHGHLMAAMIPGPKVALSAVKKGKKAITPTMPVGYVLSNGHRRLYFAGDGAFGGQFEQVHDRFGAPDVSILNIAASKSTLHLRATPLTADQAHQAQVLLNSPVTISLPQAPSYHAPEQDQAASSTCLITPKGDETIRIFMGRTGPCEASDKTSTQSHMPVDASPSPTEPAPKKDVQDASPTQPAPTSPSQPTAPAPAPEPAPAPNPSAKP